MAVTVPRLTDNLHHLTDSLLRSSHPVTKAARRASWVSSSASLLAASSPSSMEVNMAMVSRAMVADIHSSSKDTTSNSHNTISSSRKGGLGVAWVLVP